MRARRTRRWQATRAVLQFEQMGNTITIRIPEDLAAWLDEAARKAGVSKGRLIRDELERARRSEQRAFMSLAGIGSGPPGLSTRKGFSRR
jgi:predicted transcriptional regulator